MASLFPIGIDFGYNPAHPIPALLPPSLCIGPFLSSSYRHPTPLLRPTYSAFPFPCLAFIPFLYPGHNQHHTHASISHLYFYHNTIAHYYFPFPISIMIRFTPIQYVSFKVASMIQHFLRSHSHPLHLIAAVDSPTELHTGFEAPRFFRSISHPTQ